MPALSPTRIAVTLVRAGLKAAMSRVRGTGMIREYADWPGRIDVCRHCPMHVVQCGVSYCGRPFLRRPIRDPVREGCGCPTVAKAKDAAEHCPVTMRYDEPTPGDACDCKWCVTARRLTVLPTAA